MIHGPLHVVSASRYLELVREAVGEYGMKLLAEIEGDEALKVELAAPRYCSA